jgi:hypothetical protein
MLKTKTTQSSSDVNPYSVPLRNDLRPTPPHLKLDRAKLDAALALRREGGISDVYQAIRQGAARDECPSTPDRPETGSREAVEGPSPTQVSASIPGLEETWQDRERRLIRELNGQEVEAYLEQVSAQCEQNSPAPPPGYEPPSWSDGRPLAPPRKAARGQAFSRVLRKAKAAARHGVSQLKRMIGGHQGLPPYIRRQLTQGKQAVAMVIGEQCRKHGSCTLSIGHISAMAGVSRSLVNDTKRSLRAMGAVSTKERRRSSCRSLPTVITIVCAEWLSWIRKGPLGGWFQKFGNNKSRDRFYVRAVTAESETQPTTGCIGHPRSAALCLDSG